MNKNYKRTSINQESYTVIDCTFYPLSLHVIFAVGFYGRHYYAVIYLGFSDILSIHAANFLWVGGIIFPGGLSVEGREKKMNKGITEKLFPW